MDNVASANEPNRLYAVREGRVYSRTAEDTTPYAPFGPWYAMAAESEQATTIAGCDIGEAPDGLWVTTADAKLLAGDLSSSPITWDEVETPATGASAVECVKNGSDLRLFIIDALGEIWYADQPGAWIAAQHPDELPPVFVSLDAAPVAGESPFLLAVDETGATHKWRDEVGWKSF